MNLKKLFSYSTLLMSTVSSAFAQCVVGGTDFDTNTDLCCPILSSDSKEGGWYNEALDWDKLCKGDMFIGPDAVFHKGLLSNAASTIGSLDMSDIDKIFLSKNIQMDASGVQYGKSTVTAQPKLINPFLKANETANNMFVNVGARDRFPLLDYSVAGLEPGSDVTISFDVYNLFDVTYFRYLNDTVCKGTGAVVPKMSDFMVGYNYVASQNEIGGGNSLVFGVTSSADVAPGKVLFDPYNQNLMQMSSMDNYKTAKVDYGSSEKITYKTKVPETGSLTFYFFKASDCYKIPVGIDNIEIVGSIKPVITYTGNPCPQQPIRVSTKQNYPEGTKFSWNESVTGQTSTDANFIFIPTEPDTDYKVTCEVTLPGCTPAKSDPLTIHSGVCCTTADGTPMAMTNLFFDDFGNFVSDDTYEWTDRYGVTHTEKIPADHTLYAMSIGGSYRVPCVRAYNIESSGATLRVPYVKDEGINNQLYDHGMYAVSAHGAYPSGVQNDNSGTTTGGMLQFDLLDDGSQDDFFEIDVEHICTGKEITFGADFASISEWPGCIEVQLLYGDKVLAEESKSFTGGLDGWKSVNKTFTIGAQEIGGESEATVTMKIRHNNECLEGHSNYRGETRDYAIDNILFSVCTPPDVTLESSVSTGKELYDLCTEDVLNLTAISSDAVKRFYLSNGVAIDPTKKIGYVYQYTFQDPSTANEINKIKWTTIHKEEVIESESFDIEIEKYWDDIFSKMSSDDRIYFRVVVGEYSDLIEDLSWKTTSAFSPCRKVSISNIPVVASVKCATCTTPDPVEFSAVGGTFDAAKKTVVLSAGDSVVIGMANPVHGIDQDGNDYNDYAVKWYKNSLKSIHFLAKKCSKGKDVAPEFTVKYDDVKAAGATGVKYIIYIHDNFDPSSATTPCDIYDTITVIGLVSDPEPVKEENVVYLFYDDFGNFVSDDTYEWTDITGEKHTETIPAGQVHTSQSHGYDIKIPYVKAYNLEASGATLNIPLVGGDKPELYYFGVYVVSKFGSYPGGVKFDNSGTETGGMLQFDLLDDGSQDDFFEMNLENICYGKEISFGADIASFSSWPSHIEILLERNGDTIASADAIVEGSIGWKTINATTVINPDDSNSPIKLKIRYLGSGYMGGGDIAIDNIFVSTTVPPVLTLESSVSASDTLSLCKGDLTMTAKISQSDNISYENLNYLFQYTYTDPSSTDAEKIKWEDLGGILENNSVSISIISPLYQDVFELLKEDEPGNIYFRVVAGEKEDLLAKDLWADNTALSPCRIVSISSNVLVAGLQCENSSSAQVDANNEVSIYPNPASTNITVVADGVVEKVEILNTVGEVVKVSDSKDINIADLHNGVYFVRATIDDETSVHKLVINK